ncbi:hypothetical protein [Helicobacter sp. MIT 14-3879]|uniref:hypothetical protein n=1 Tax=Helicobacter sp. MIT 14-3879 TaxID=2040649 RepID=UPI000E1EF8C6|nr:hypothetical protein [Helicobacter sp. MIT 14-3879]RDU60378.1 hypothetical protein CQA44_10640 [Helicobacter sp. MIT 14-3879]
MGLVDISNLYKNFSEKCKKISFDLEQNKIDINDNDSLGDKTFFAFLADLLKAFKKEGLNGELINELKQNENLTKEKLNRFLKEELQNNTFLSKQEKIKVAKLLNSNLSNDLTIELIENKFREINDFRAKEVGMSEKDRLRKLDTLEFSARDIQKITAKHTKEQTKQSVKEVIKHTLKIQK